MGAPVSRGKGRQSQQNDVGRAEDGGRGTGGKGKGGGWKEEAGREGVRQKRKVDGGMRTEGVWQGG